MLLVQLRINDTRVTFGNFVKIRQAAVPIPIRTILLMRCTINKSLTMYDKTKNSFTSQNNPIIPLLLFACDVLFCTCKG